MTFAARTFSGKCWSEELELFLGIHNRELGYFTPDEMLVPTPLEQQRVDQLVAQLRSLGVEPQC